MSDLCVESHSSLKLRNLCKKIKDVSNLVQYNYLKKMHVVTD